MNKILRTALIYSPALLLLCSAPLLSSHSIGVLGVDAIDTLQLRWLFWQPEQAFWPMGYPVHQLAPNWLDHLSAGLLLALPAPLGDNIWTLLMLLLNGLAAHHLGRRVSSHRWSGAAGALMLLSCEAMWREVNLQHAPQLMLFAPLMLLAELSGESPRARRVGIWLGVSALCYWFWAPMLLLATAPLLYRRSRKWMLVAAGWTAALTGPQLLWMLLQRPAILSSPQTLPMNGLTVQEAHGSELDFWLRTSWVDSSNLLPISALIVAAMVLWQQRPWRQLWMLGLGAVMLLGPSLNGLSLPFSWLSALPGFERLMWPERWGIIAFFGLMLLVLRHRWALPAAALMLVEMLARSPNLPVQHSSLVGLQPLTALQSLEGAVLSLPIEAGPINRSALEQRFHQRPLVNPMLLPPQVAPPGDWESWRQQQPWMQELVEQQQLSETGASALRSSGIGALILSEGWAASPGAAALQERLSDRLGAPQRLGCHWIWLLETPSTELSEQLEAMQLCEPESPIEGKWLQRPIGG